MFHFGFHPNASGLSWALWSPWEETLEMHYEGDVPNDTLEGVKSAADVKRQIMQRKLQVRSVTQPTANHYDPYLAIIVDRKTKATLAEYKVLASDDYFARHKAVLLHERNLGRSNDLAWTADAVSMADEVFGQARRELKTEGFSLLMY